MVEQWEKEWEKEKQYHVDQRRKKIEEIQKRDAASPIWAERAKEGERIEASFRRTQEELARIQRLMDGKR